MPAARSSATDADGLAGIQGSVKAGLGRVEQALGEAVATADPFVQEAAGYLVAAGGKRMRPTLVLISGHTGDPDEARLVGAAVAIELTHLSSLYHDDVMDEAELRRGARSANARYDNKVAVLTGDYLFARASEVTANLGTEATRVLARAIARLTQGQIREVRGPGPGDDPVEHYLAVLADKTGALIAAACRLGGYLAGADVSVVAALTEFGERVGRAFQLGDDLLDITGEAEVAGKAPGGDLRAGVRTLPVLYLLRQGGPDAARVAAVLDGDHVSGAVDDALDRLRRSPALAEARRTAQAEVAAARAALEGVPAGPVRFALSQVADQVLDRQVSGPGAGSRRSARPSWTGPVLPARSPWPVDDPAVGCSAMGPSIAWDRRVADLAGKRVEMAQTFPGDLDLDHEAGPTPAARSSGPSRTKEGRPLRVTCAAAHRVSPGWIARSEPGTIGQPVALGLIREG
jgi:heptaprenyl diphosphate synthase